MSTAIWDTVDKIRWNRWIARKKKDRWQGYRREMRRNEARGVGYGDFPLRKAARTVRRSAGSRPNALSLLSGFLRPLPTSAHPPAPNRLITFVFTAAEIRPAYLWVSSRLAGRLFRARFPLFTRKHKNRKTFVKAFATVFYSKDMPFGVYPRASLFRFLANKRSAQTRETLTES